MPDIARLRRFALSIGLVLFFYSIAGVKLKTSADIRLLGFTFEVLRPNLLPVVLILTSAYAAARYWYYGMVVSSSPHQTRKEMLAGTIPTRTLLELSGNTGISVGQIHLLLKRFYPRMDFNSDVLSQAASQLRLALPPIKFWTKLLNGLENLDYTAPVWINALAIAAYFTLLVLNCAGGAK